MAARIYAENIFCAYTLMHHNGVAHRCILTLCSVRFLPLHDSDHVVWNEFCSFKTICDFVPWKRWQCHLNWLVCSIFSSKYWEFTIRHDARTGASRARRLSKYCFIRGENFVAGKRMKENMKTIQHDCAHEKCVSWMQIVQVARAETQWQHGNNEVAGECNYAFFQNYVAVYSVNTMVGTVHILWLATQVCIIKSTDKKCAVFYDFHFIRSLFNV